MRPVTLTFSFLQIGIAALFAQGELGRGFPYGDDGGWGGLLNVLIVAVVGGVVIAILWIIWEIIRAVLSSIISWLK